MIKASLMNKANAAASTLVTLFSKLNASSRESSAARIISLICSLIFLILRHGWLMPNVREWRDFPTQNMEEMYEGNDLGERR